MTVPESNTVTEALLRAIASMIHNTMTRAARLLRLDQILREHRGPEDAFAAVRLNSDEDDGSMTVRNV